MKTMMTVAAALALASAASAQQQLYALQGFDSPVLLRLDPSNGSVLDAHNVTGQQALDGLAADASGNLYSIDGYNDSFPDRLFRIDAATGAGTAVGNTGFNWNFRTVSFDPSTNILYGATDNALYTMNRSTGAATLLTVITAPNLDQLTAFAVDGLGHAYFTDIGNTDLFTMDLTTLRTGYIDSISFGQTSNWYACLAFDSSGRLWGSRANGGVYIIDVGTARETLQFSGRYTGLAFTEGASQSCYPNCDNSTAAPILNVNDFICFQTRFVAGDSYANCDLSTAPPILNVNDFICFQQAFAAGCP